MNQRNSFERYLLLMVLGSEGQTEREWERSVWGVCQLNVTHKVDRLCACYVILYSSCVHLSHPLNFSTEISSPFISVSVYIFSIKLTVTWQVKAGHVSFLLNSLQIFFLPTALFELSLWLTEKFAWKPFLDSEGVAGRQERISNRWKWDGTGNREPAETAWGLPTFLNTKGPDREALWGNGNRGSTLKWFGLTVCPSCCFLQYAAVKGGVIFQMFGKGMSFIKTSALWVDTYSWIFHISLLYRWGNATKKHFISSKHC